MTGLEAFYPEVAVRVQDCPEPVIAHAVRNACIDFCQRTRSWRVNTEDESVDGEDFPYVLVLPDGAELFRVEAVKANGTDLRPILAGTLDREAGDWRADHGLPKHWLMDDEERLMVYPTPPPGTSVLLSVRAICQPARAATTVPDYLWRNHSLAIVDGAMAWLYSMPEKPWFHPDMAARHAELFQARAQELRHDINQSLNGATTRVRAHFV